MQIKKNNLTFSSWNVHGLGDKMEDKMFHDKIKSDFNILLETWKGSCKEYNIEGFNCISKIRKKSKKARRHSGGIIVFYRKEFEKGISYLVEGTHSQNRLWLKLNKDFFGFSDHIYMCAVYIPPISSVHSENDYISLEMRYHFMPNKEKLFYWVTLMEEQATSDYIINDSTEINKFDGSDLLPANYIADDEIRRNAQDKVLNAQGKSLLEMCISSRLRILNGRFIGDSLGYFTYLSPTGSKYS